MTIQAKYDAVVIGAGLGGIAVSLRLKKMGLSVLVIEKNPRHGGKLEEWEWEGFQGWNEEGIFGQEEINYEVVILKYLTMHEFCLE